MCLLGYLLDTAVQRISGEILSLVDITEIESNRLHDLVKLLQPLEALFVLQADQVSLRSILSDCSLTDVALHYRRPGTPLAQVLLHR